MTNSTGLGIFDQFSYRRLTQFSYTTQLPTVLTIFLRDQEHLISLTVDTVIINPCYILSFRRISSNTVHTDRRYRIGITVGITGADPYTK